MLNKLLSGQYEVKNTETGKIHAKHTTKPLAEAQIHLLRAIEHNPHFILRNRF